MDQLRLNVKLSWTIAREPRRLKATAGARGRSSWVSRNTQKTPGISRLVLHCSLCPARIATFALKAPPSVTIATPRTPRPSINVPCLALREAVTNIVRVLMQPSAMWRSSRERGTIHFMVEGNGLGGQIRQSNGLRGMRERVEFTAGATKWTASRGERTRPEITLALESESREQSASRFVGEVGTL
jgi:hypothetical protein